MTDQEFAEFLRKVPREIPEGEVVARGRVHDNTDGEYFNHHLFPHHYGESEH